MAEIKVATVIPIGEGIFKDSLSYFTLKDIKPGSLVFVPIRKKRMPAILISSKPVSEMRAEIKNSQYELKKIEKTTDEELFSKEFMETAEETADFYAANLGQVINCFVPNNLLKGYERAVKDRKNKKTGSAEKGAELERRHTVELVQAPYEDRIAFYKSLIREDFAKKLSVFICAPTIHEVNIFSDALKKGIENYTVVARPEDSPKKMANVWQKICNSSHPLLIIGTPLFLCLINDSMGTIVVEKESSPAHKSIGRPFADSRFFAEKLAQKMFLRLIFGDTVLRIETLQKKEKDIYLPSLLFKHRLIGKAKERTINMRQEKGEAKAIGEELFELLEESIRDGKNSMLLCARKGFANSTVCRDCKKVVTCKKCSGTITLHKKESDNHFSCHRCGINSSTNVLCEKCRSWNLKTIGFGTEKIEEEIKQRFKEAKILRIDGETVKTYKQGRDIMCEFLINKGSILIGTEMSLFYLTKNIENIAIVSADTLLFIPDFKTNERLFNYAVGAKLLAENNFLIQTRAADNPIFDKILRGDTLQFYREEILSRKNHEYPPFKLFIKITAEGKEEVIEKEFDELAVFLKRWNPEKFKSPGKLQNGTARMNILIKVKPDNWPDKPETNTDDPNKMTLLEILRMLPPRFVVKVDADSLL